MLAITGVNVVLKDHLIFDGYILISGNRILDYGRMESAQLPAGIERLDGGGLYVGPGLIDIHTHAGDGKLFCKEPEAAAEAHLRQGTTTVIPALYFNLSRAQMLEAAQAFRRARQKPLSRNIRGIYMEGPYLNPGFGCETAGNQWSGAVLREDYQPLIEGVSDLARVWCIAPEREGIEGFVRDVKAALPGVVLSVAHSAATPEEVERLIPQGLRLATHHTNATGTLDKYPECRGVCVDEAVNSNPEIYAELICDRMGIHVDPYMLRLVRRVKGRDRLILVSDSFVADGPIPDGYSGATDILFDHAGEIAGTKLTLNMACRNMMQHTGCGICDGFAYASLNPAKLLGLTGYGCIERGNVADLVLVDDQMNVRHVFLDGQMCF